MKDYFIRMKNKYVIGLLILATIGLSAVYAQLPEQRPLSKLTINDVLRYVNKYSVIYIEKVVQREKRGDFPLNPDEAKEVQRSIEDVMSALQRVDDSGSVFPKGLSPESLNFFLHRCWSARVVRN